MTFRRLALFAGVIAVALALTGCNSESFFDSLKGETGQSQVTLSLLLMVGTFVSEDLSCITAGVIAADGRAPLWMVTLACFFGIWIGDLGLFLLGRIGGAKCLHRAPLKWIVTPEGVARGKRLFDRHGGKFVFTSRFLPGSRVPVYVAAGMVGYSMVRFAAWMAIACALWTPLLVGLSSLLGEPLLNWLERYEKLAWIVIPIIVLFVWTLTHLLLSLSSHRGRRLLYSRWCRFKEWEFWPMWAFYPPIALYLIWLGFKHRSLTVFTLANPAIPFGGLALESKSQILAGLSKNSETRHRIARFRAIEPASPDTRSRQLESFIKEEDLSWPVVLKPDVGERGQGVGIVQNKEEALNFLSECPHPVIAQEFIGGIEFGVFYYRMPGEKQGKILSITEKQLPRLTGDGESTLEDLILNDSRTVRMARFFLRQWSARLDEIPAKGETIRIAKLGTHCRGAIFLDGRQHVTESLTRSIDELSRHFDGFYFGRYDLKVPSSEALESGDDWKVLELNGVTSESTHIYHPGYSLFQAYRDLFRQWRICFEIGEALRQKGAQPPSIREIREVIRQHARHDWFEANSTST